MPDKIALELASQISNQNLSKEGWTTYYVDGTNGNDGANGLTWNSAFATIQHAVDTAKSWAKIYVKAGTYAENVRISSKHNIHLIGENKTTTIIVAPTGGTAATSSAIVFEDSIGCTVESFKLTGQDYYGAYFVNSDYGTVQRCFCFDCHGGVSFYNSNDGLVQDNIIDGNAQTPAAGYGGVRINITSLRTNISQNTIHNYGAFGAAIWALADEAIIKDNTCYNTYFGIHIAAANTKCTVVHNNFENITNTYIRDDSGNADVFENYYDVHTTDTNNDGITDTPYVYTGGTDYSPVSRRNGWKQISLGNVAGSSIAEIEANIGDFQAQTNLRTLLAALGIPDVAGKSLYTTLITDRLDNATFGLSAIETLIDDLETRLSAVRAGYLDELAAANLPADIDTIKADTQTIEDVTLKAAPTAGSLSRFIASGGTALGTQLPDSKSLYDVVVVDRLSGAEVVSSYNLPNDLVENTAIEIVTGSRQRLGSIWLDFVNLVQNVTIKVYHKIDGTNYRQYDTYLWTTGDEDGILITDVTINNDWKLTITNDVVQGAIKAIPYNIIKTPME